MMRALKLFCISLMVSMATLMAGCRPEKTVKVERKGIVERPRVEFNISKDAVKKVVLDNGMTVLVFPKKDVPKVLVQIAYNIGSDVEESGERGLAHLIEHMIFKGTKKLSETDIWAIGRKYGASMNAFTSKELTSYYFEIDKNNWKPFVDILADCMENVRFNEEHLASEMKAVLQELRMGKDNHVRWLLKKSCELIYPANHPYHHPTIGYKEDIMGLSAERLKKFYKKYYHPQRAVLFVVGDVDTDEIVRVVRDKFARIPRGVEAKPRVFPENIVEIGNQTARLFEDVKQEVQAFFWKVPGLKELGRTLTSITEGVLGQGEGSVLYRRLVDEEKIATAVLTAALQFRESGVFFIALEPKAGQKDRCREVVKEELNKIINGGIDSDALVKIVRRKERKFLGLFESPSSLIYEWMQSFFATGDEHEIFNRVDEFYQTTEEKVQEYVKNHLDPLLMNELQVLPIPEEHKNRWIENKQRSEKMDALILEKFVRTQPVEPPAFAPKMSDPHQIDFLFPKPDRVVELENGLKVVLRRSVHVPLLHFECLFKNASYLSKAKEGQLLDVAMNSLIERSIGATKEENVDFFEMYGAGYAFDSQGARLSSVNVGYKPVLERLFHVLTKPSFDQKLVEKVKAIFVDAYNRSTDVPTEVAFRLFLSMIYRNHPYGWTFDEMIEGVENLSISNLYSLHKKYVSPHNMFIVLSGDFDLDQMEADLKAIFGKWSGGSEVVVSVETGTFMPDEKRDYPMLRDQVVFLLGRPSPLDVYHPDRIPLKLINFISFYSLGSRIFALRERSGLFYTAAGGFGEGLTKVPGYDFLYTLLSVDTLDAAEKAVRELIDKIGSDGITEQELKDAKRWCLKGLIDLISSNAAVARTFGYLEEFALGFDYYDKVLKRVQAMTVAEINEIARKYANSKDFARIRVGRV